MIATCCQNESATDETMASEPTTFNDTEVDLSHFSVCPHILGLGGFGMVRKVTKLTGTDSYQSYALKSMSKGMVLARQTGIAAVMTELKALIMVEDCEFICRLHYAFQDEAHLYMVMDYAACGDLRYNLRLSPLQRFSESLSRVFVHQILSALHHCHLRAILHRGNSLSLSLSLSLCCCIIELLT
jgi:serine/threonine protein kinase